MLFNAASKKSSMFNLKEKKNNAKTKQHDHGNAQENHWVLKIFKGFYFQIIVLLFFLTYTLKMEKYECVLGCFVLCALACQKFLQIT